MTETTVQRVEETESSVEYCDICGGRDGALEAEGKYHFHPDCREDVFVDDPLLTTKEHTQDSDGSLSPVSVPDLENFVPTLPDEGVPPALEGVPSKLTDFLKSTVPRVLFWPIGGLWWVSHTDLFGVDVSHMDTTHVYFINTLLWTLSTLIFFGILFA